MDGELETTIHNVLIHSHLTRVRPGNSFFRIGAPINKIIGSIEPTKGFLQFKQGIVESITFWDLRGTISPIGYRPISKFYFEDVVEPIGLLREFETNILRFG